MADIAMLVAEEYERRIKMGRKAGDQEMGLVSVLGPVQELIKAKWVTEARLQFADKVDQVVVEPRTRLGGAALDAFFSA